MMSSSSDEFLLAGVCRNFAARVHPWATVGKGYVSTAMPADRTANHMHRLNFDYRITSVRRP